LSKKKHSIFFWTNDMLVFLLFHFFLFKSNAMQYEQLTQEIGR
jgi:hypothetical protein